MKYELAIFDMDGTILNTLEDLTDSINYALRECGMAQRSIDEVKYFVGNGTKHLIDEAVPSGTTQELKDRVYQIYIPYYEAHSADKTDAYPGIKLLLQNLKDCGCKTAVVSNKPDAAVKKLAEEYFPGLFDIAVGEDEAHGRRRKPNPDETEYVLKELGVDRAQAVYIGDSDVDVATAANSKLNLIAVDWGFREHSFLEEQGAKIIVSNPREIEEIIKE